MSHDIIISGLRWCEKTRCLGVFLSDPYWSDLEEAKLLAHNIRNIGTVRSEFNKWVLMIHRPQDPYIFWKLITHTIHCGPTWKICARWAQKLGLQMDNFWSPQAEISETH